jgi:hypothetical protein
MKFSLYACVCEVFLFKDAVNGLDYTALNDRMMSEYWAWKEWNKAVAV